MTYITPRSWVAPKAFVRTGRADQWAVANNPNRPGSADYHWWMADFYADQSGRLGVITGRWLAASAICWVLYVALIATSFVLKLSAA